MPAIDKAYLERTLPVDPPLFLAGTIGGPAAVGLLTPLRNGLAVATHDQATVSPVQIMRMTFARAPFRGALMPTIMSAPTFVMLGPAYHFYRKQLSAAFGASADSPMVNGTAIGICAGTETALMYAAETRNAQMATIAMTGRQLPLQPVWSPFGVGTVLHWSRNLFSMSGVRVVAPALNDSLLRTTGIDVRNSATASIGVDFIASCVVSGVSTPLHQVYLYLVAQAPSERKRGAERLSELRAFLKRQYFRQNEATGRLQVSPLALRDVSLRVAYNAALWTIYAACERGAIHMWNEY